MRERLTEACERRERDPATLRLSLMNATLVGADDHELAARERRVAERTGNPPDDTWTMGTVDEVVGQLHDLAAAGVERVYVQHLLHDDLDMVRLIGREIVPRLAR